MKTLILFSLCLLLGGSAALGQTTSTKLSDNVSGNTPGDSVHTSNAAIAAIKKLGGSVRFDRKGEAEVNFISSQVTDADLVFLKELPTLNSLVLRSRKVTGTGFEHLKGLTNLTTLYLLDTGVTDVGLEYLTNVPTLVNLSLRLMPITDAGLERLKGLTNLRHLYIDRTKISDAGLEHLKGLRLTGLYVQNTAVTDAGLAHLTAMTTLQNLDLSRTKVTDAGVKKLQQALPDCKIVSGNTPGASVQPDKEQEAAIAAIKELGGRVIYSRTSQAYRVLLEGTQFTDDSLSLVIAVGNVKYLQLAKTSITDDGLAQLKEMKNLTDFQYWRPRSPVRMSDKGLAHFSGMTQLTSLSIPGTTITDAGLRHLEGLTNLQVLNLKGSQITDAGLEHLKDLTRLEHLELYDTRISDAGLEHLKGLTALQILKLRRTSVTDAGIEKLEQALPNCRVNQAFPRRTPQRN